MLQRVHRPNVGCQEQQGAGSSCMYRKPPNPAGAVGVPKRNTQTTLQSLLQFADLTPLLTVSHYCVPLQKYIIDVAYSTAQEFVWDGKHEEARPAALHALRFSIEVYGSNSLQLVPAYLLLAEASTGAGHLPEASKYLSQAEWIVLRTPDCSAAVQYKLHRSLGLFCAAKGNFEQALYHLANDVYLASSTFGLQSIETSGGYFHMANIFFRQNKMDIANSLYAEVDNWAVLNILSCTQTYIQQDCFIPNAAEAQQVEGIRVLNAILDIREQAPTQQPGETAKVLHALAMLHYLLMDLPKVGSACSLSLAPEQSCSSPRSSSGASSGLAPAAPRPSGAVAPELDQDCRGGLLRAQQRGRIL
uniref:Zinc finger MYND-type containing 12 n=1 Tax=Strigops habroptila TaxID=2489341 RepID=A0A672UX36_STRHB